MQLERVTPRLAVENSATENVLPAALRDLRATLIVAHPGHELRVHGWLEAARPVVYVLTDGSGHSGQSRLDSTTRVLARAYAQPGAFYGRFTDVQLYTAILDKHIEFFVDIAEEVAEALLRDGVDYVVGDAAEGYNPTHDICRAIIDTAVALVNKNRGDPVLNLEFPVVAAGNPLGGRSAAGAIHLHLSTLSIDRKLAAARSYAELRDEISGLIKEMGINSFGIEELRPAANGTAIDRAVEEPPFYENYGEKQVAEGHYRRVIRYREHVLPVSEALSGYVQKRAL